MTEMKIRNLAAILFPVNLRPGALRNNIMLPPDSLSECDNEFSAGFLD